jgi:hypothetical protein
MNTLSKPKIQIATIIRWIARIWGGLILAFVLFFLLAHVIGSITGDGEQGGGFANIQEVIAFICFPIGTIIGLALAYKWEGLGGLIASLGLIIMLVILTVFMPIPENASFSDFFKRFSFFIFFIFPPGLLYLIFWYLSKKN